MEEQPNKTEEENRWRNFWALVGQKWWLPPLLLAFSIVILGWVVLQALEYASPFVYVAF